MRSLWTRASWLAHNAVWTVLNEANDGPSLAIECYILELVNLLRAWRSLGLQNIATALGMVLRPSLDKAMHFAELAIHRPLGAFHADSATHDLHFLLVDESANWLALPLSVHACTANAHIPGSTLCDGVIAARAWVAAGDAEDNLPLVSLQAVERSWT